MFGEISQNSRTAHTTIQLICNIRGKLTTLGEKGMKSLYEIRFFAQKPPSTNVTGMCYRQYLKYFAPFFFKIRSSYS